MAAKDTMMKLLMRALSQGALGAVGIFNVELTESLPNDLPANTLAIDKAWRMMDGRIFWYLHSRPIRILYLMPT